MKVISYLSIICSMLLIITGCGKTSNLSYADAYDEIITNYISLDSLSAITGMSQSSLIRLRFDESDSNQIAVTLSEILSALEKGDSKRISSIQAEVKKSPVVYDNNLSNNEILSLSKKIEQLKSTIEEKKRKNLYLSQNSYDLDYQQLNNLEADLKREHSNRQKESAIILQKQIESFSQNTPVIIFNFIDNDIDDYINEKYSLLNAIPNTWNYYTKSNEKFIEDFLKDFNWSELSSKCESYYINRLNSFKDDLVNEQNVILGNKIEIPDFNVIPGENTFIIDEDLEILVKERVKSQIKELSSDILWDIIIDLVICAIITSLMNKSIDNSTQKAIKKFLKKARWEKNDGLLKNLGRNILHGVGIYGEYEEEVEAIKNRYGRYKFFASIAVFFIGFIVSWIFFIKPQLRIEADLNEVLATKIMDSSNTLHINPAKVLSLYLNTNIEDQNSGEIEVASEEEIDEDRETSETAVKDLYSIFYWTDSTPDWWTYSESIKNKFKELGITSSLKEPYTPSFEAEINRMESLSKKVVDLGGGLYGFDADILFGSQGDGVDINLVVCDLEILDTDKVIIKAKYTNGEEYDRVFKMKRIDGAFKIDDMDGTREFIERECEDAEKYLRQLKEEAN